MESLRDNRPLLWSIVASILAVVTLVLGSFPDMCSQFSIVEFPAEVSLVSRASRVANACLTVLRPSVPADTTGQPGCRLGSRLRRGSPSLLPVGSRKTAILVAFITRSSRLPSLGNKINFHAKCAKDSIRCHGVSSFASGRVSRVRAREQTTYDSRVTRQGRRWKRVSRLHGSRQFARHSVAPSREQGKSLSFSFSI